MFVVVVLASSTVRVFGSYGAARAFFASVTTKGREAYLLRRNVALQLGYLPSKR